MIFFFLEKIYKIIHPNASLNHTEQRKEKIIVSFTSIPPRIKKIDKVVIRILEQTIKPDKILIYIGKNEFQDVPIPIFLRIQMKLFGVEVRYVDDIGPHTKYFYAISEFPNGIIITIDDDVRYPNDVISELYASYLKHPRAISARRCHLITFDTNGEIKRYNDWLYKYSDLIDTPSFKLFPTGVGGVLYPPKSLHAEVFNLESIKKNALKNDDIWLKFMEIMNGTPVVMTKPFTIKHVKGSQKVALNLENVKGQGNDICIQKMINSYDNFFGTQDTLLNRIKHNDQ